MIDVISAFKQKTELLCKGLFLDEKLIPHYKAQGINIDYGRTGGAGPYGGRYFLLEDDLTLVNVALWNTPERTDLFLKENKNGYFEVFNEKKKGIIRETEVNSKSTFLQSRIYNFGWNPNEEDCIGTWD
ncbi:MAG: hypothetical protein ACW96X_02845 [Promethearchaeota archaeon]|jgi:hypothetical protein